MKCRHTHTNMFSHNQHGIEFFSAISFPLVHHLHTNITLYNILFDWARAFFSFLSSLPPLSSATHTLTYPWRRHRRIHARSLANKSHLIIDARIMAKRTENECECSHLLIEMASWSFPNHFHAINWYLVFKLIFSHAGDDVDWSNIWNFVNKWFVDFSTMLLRPRQLYFLLLVCSISLRPSLFALARLCTLYILAFHVLHRHSSLCTRASLCVCIALPLEMNSLQH